MIGAALDGLGFSSLWVAAAAGALCAAASLAMGTPPAIPAVGIAAAGTLLVYNVDRLRDLERDRATSPLRSAFVARFAPALRALAVAAAGASLGFGAWLGPRPVLVLLPVLVLGLAHRRLKDLPFLKSAYITAGWLAVVVFLPAVHARGASHVAWVAACVTPALLANAVASSLRDREAAVSRFGTRRGLWAARAVAALGVGAGAAAPPPVRPLVAVPAATLVALLAWRRGERYGLLVVDGALLVGALVALGAGR